MSRLGCSVKRALPLSDCTLKAVREEVHIPFLKAEIIKEIDSWWDNSLARFHGAFNCIYARASPDLIRLYPIYVEQQALQRLWALWTPKNFMRIRVSQDQSKVAHAFTSSPSRHTKNALASNATPRGSFGGVWFRRCCKSCLHTPLSHVELSLPRLSTFARRRGRRLKRVTPL